MKKNILLLAICLIFVACNKEETRMEPIASKIEATLDINFVDGSKNHQASAWMVEATCSVPSALVLRTKAGIPFKWGNFVYNEISKLWEYQTTLSEFDDVMVDDVLYINPLSENDPFYEVNIKECSLQKTEVR